jgi:hypothetical protein
MGGRGLLLAEQREQRSSLQEDLKVFWLWWCSVSSSEEEEGMNRN